MVAYLSGTPGQVTCAGTVLPGAPGAGSKKNGSVASPGRMGWLHFGQIAMSSVGSGSLGSAVWEVGGGPGLLGGVLADGSASLGRASSASLRRAHSNSFAMLRGVPMLAAYSTHRSAPERAFDRAGTRTPKMRGYTVGSGLKSRHRQADTRLVPKVAEKSVEPEPCPKTWQGKRCKLQKGHLEPCKYDL